MNRGFVSVLISVAVAVTMLLFVGGVIVLHSQDPNAGSGGAVINTGGALVSTDIDTCSEVATILTGQTTGTCGSVVLSASPTFTGTSAFALLTATNATSTWGSITNGLSIGTTTSGSALLHIDGGASTARLRLDGDTGVARIFSFATDNLARWALRVDGAESGSDAGADFAIRRYNDAGTFVDAPISIVRSTGVTTISSLTLSTDLSVANGGTGASTLTGLLQGNGTSAITGVTGTAGQYPYFNGTNTLLATSTLFLDTTGKLGIGSTTPKRKLSIDGSVAIQEATLTDGATVTWDLSASSYARVNITASRTLDITNATEAIGQSVRLVVCADGAWSLTWDALIMWPAGTAPTQTATANKCDVYSGFVTNGSSTPKIFLGSVLNF